MFFRREKAKEFDFAGRLQDLKPLGFSVQPEAAGRMRVVRDGCAAILEDRGEGKVGVSKAGVMLGDEVAQLVHAGYQMFLRAPSGKEAPALASHLKVLHAFDEDLKEGLGQVSLYNIALGTTCDDHLYDRVTARDSGHQPRPWER